MLQLTWEHLGHLRSDGLKYIHKIVLEELGQCHLCIGAVEAARKHVTRVRQLPSSAPPVRTHCCSAICPACCCCSSIVHPAATKEVHVQSEELQA